MATTRDITIVRGTTIEPIEIVFTNEAGDQIDLQSGWIPYAQVRKKPHAAIVMDLVPTVIPTGVLLGYDGEIDGPGRVMLGAFTLAQTLALSDAVYAWDIVLQDPIGQRFGPYVQGKFNIITIITEPD